MNDEQKAADAWQRERFTIMELAKTLHLENEKDEDVLEFALTFIRTAIHEGLPMKVFSDAKAQRKRTLEGRRTGNWT